MRGLMQDWPLLLHRIIDHAAIQFGGREVVTRTLEGPVERSSYAAIRARALRVAQRLARDGVAQGDRIATLAWNSARHLEVWYGVAGAGAVCHTINPRLFPDQIAWIVDHAQDRALLLDLTFVPLMERLAPALRSVERFVILTDVAHMPETSLRGAIAYEDWIGEGDGDFAWVDLDERAAAGLCYTSGTTGEPKGVLYSHRSNVLHAMSLIGEDAFGLSARSVILPIVPMFHANAWSLAFSCPMVGAKLVMPGAKLDGASLYQLIEEEGVTMAAGVPTIGMGLLAHLKETGARFSTLERVLIGGSACPRAMVQAFEELAVDVRHAWGMTEMSPVGTFGAVKPAHGAPSGDALYDLKAKQGYAGFGVETRIADEAGAPLPWDGAVYGQLKVAGFAVAERYYREEASALDAHGFFDTGDVATIDPDGIIEIVDRSKDMIKSGGEWISSIALENAAIAHPDVAEAAAIGLPHPRWGERPLLVVVARPGRTVDEAALIAFLRARVAAWQAPDAVRVVDEIPHTAVGKIDKKVLRARFALGA